METFLSDYGLVWKGSGGPDEGSDPGDGGGAEGGGGRGDGARVGDRLLPGEAAAVAAVAAGTPHFDVFLAKIKELNGLLETSGRAGAAPRPGGLCEATSFCAH